MGMTVRLVTAAIVSAATILLTTPAAAKRIPLVNRNKVEGACNDKGGAWWPTSGGHTYGCLNPDGSGIVCGGDLKEDQVCDTWPAEIKIRPTHAQVRDAIRAQAKPAG